MLKELTKKLYDRLARFKPLLDDQGRFDQQGDNKHMPAARMPIATPISTQLGA